MGVEDIIAVIQREADAEAKRIIEDAEQQAAQLIADAEAEVQSQIEVATERLGPEIRGASQRRINAVRLRLLEQRARDDAARLVAVFDAAEAQVAAIAAGADDERWAAAVSVLCEEALGSVGEGASVRIRAADADAVSGVAEAWGTDVVSLPDSADPGPVVRSHDGRIEVDARLSVRLERARSLLAEAVAQRLRLEAVDRASGSAV